MRLHTFVDDEDAQALLTLKFRTISRDHYSHIVREGDTVEHCFVVLSGLVERHRIESDGGKQILAIYVPGDPLNLDHLFLDVADDGLQTLKAAELACIKLGDMRALMAGRPSIGEALFKAFVVDSSIFREWTVNVGQRNARTRIAHLLCEIDLRLKAQGIETDGLPLPLTQYQIAEATGLTSVHVNRTLKALQAEGLLGTKATAARFADWDGLRKVAGFDLRYLHMLNYRGFP